MRRNGNSQLIFHFPPVPSTQPPPWSEWSRETPAVLIKKSNEELQCLDSSLLSLSTSEDPTEFIKPRAHTSEHTRDRRCADPFLFIFFFFSSTRPVPSENTSSFLSYNPDPWTPLWDPLLVAFAAAAAVSVSASAASGRTDSRCLPRQRDWNLFIALADRHSRALIGGTNQVRPLEERQRWSKNR